MIKIPLNGRMVFSVAHATTGEIMTELTLELDSQASESIKELMSYYRVSSKAEVISKALAVLRTAAYIDKTQGELIARKGSHETKIVV